MGNNKTLADYEVLTRDAKILEKESAGVKVYLLPGDRILKLFRRKRMFSSQIWAPHAWRFNRNARILKQRGIPTVTIEAYFNIPAIKRQAVLYKRLQGRTLREHMACIPAEEQRAIIRKLGSFVAQLHEKGILFRSLHFGNILVTSQGELALIDIVDMGFRWFGPLTVKQRIRNFHHMDRYDLDRVALAAEGDGGFIHHYLNSTDLCEKKKSLVIESFYSVFDKHRK